jgi:RNA polymerase sigma-70 factor (ECF subfamily)
MLYSELQRVTGSPVVELSRAIAVAEAGDPEAGLAIVDALADQLDGYLYLHATRADLLRRVGGDRADVAAAEAYRRALELVASDAERRFLQRRLAELG